MKIQAWFYNNKYKRKLHFNKGFIYDCDAHFKYKFVGVEFYGLMTLRFLYNKQPYK